MATKAQILANCRNALKSTGPRTRQSKAATSQNAAKRTFKTNLVKIRVICGYSLYRTNPILRKSQMNVTSFDKGKYVKLDTWSDAQKQTQTNPIRTQNKPNLQNDKNERKLLFNKGLWKNSPEWLRKNKPNQTQIREEFTKVSYESVLKPAPIKINRTANYDLPVLRSPRPFTQSGGSVYLFG